MIGRPAVGEQHHSDEPGACSRYRIGTGHEFAGTLSQEEKVWLRLRPLD